MLQSDNRGHNKIKRQGATVLLTIEIGETSPTLLNLQS